jgi:hypothetical protein
MLMSACYEDMPKNNKIEGRMNGLKQYDYGGYASWKAMYCGAYKVKHMEKRCLH